MDVARAGAVKKKQHIIVTEPGHKMSQSFVGSKNVKTKNTKTFKILGLGLGLPKTVQKQEKYDMCPLHME